MKKLAKKLEWNVVYHNVNGEEIEVHNIFDHGGVMKDIEKAVKKCDTREAFAEEMRRTLMYYYWSKAEWEVIVSPWCGGRNTKDIKIDVYWQVKMNWERFIDYLWNAVKK